VVTSSTGTTSLTVLVSTALGVTSAGTTGVIISSALVDTFPPDISAIHAFAALLATLLAPTLLLTMS